MKKNKTVLISNLGLPYQGIGSWTYEINHFLANNASIDVVLSPTDQPNSRFIFCKKKPWHKWHKINRNYFLKKWVAGEYIQALLKLGEAKHPLQILVIDDQVLLEAVALIKQRLPPGSSILFYYHGHSLSWSSSLQEKVDRVLFLTEQGYLDTIKNLERFTPRVHVLGNGIDPSLFFPISESVKRERKVEMGWGSEDLVLVWMSNSRPVKGLHLFQQMIPYLLEINDSIRILIIGNKESVSDHPRVVQTGLISGEKVAYYLQMSDFYFFTSLWKEGFGLSLAEAAQCGNYIITSANGGIPSVISEYPRCTLIHKPNVLEEWIEEFRSILEANNWKTASLANEGSDFYSLEAWEKRLLEILNN
ncbi:MAG: glycosyltransferase [Cytophagales bacterium]|nr:MAG: glycosyltransferase [Cytophagales bacterium]